MKEQRELQQLLDDGESTLDEVLTNLLLSNFPSRSPVATTELTD